MKLITLVLIFIIFCSSFAEEVCKNNQDDDVCKSWAHLCGDNPHVRNVCKRTCDSCPRLTTIPPVAVTTPKQCGNIKSSYQCWLWKPLCKANSKVKMLCMKTCNLCPKVPVTEEPEGSGDVVTTNQPVTTTVATTTTTTTICGNIKSSYQCWLWRPLCRINRSVKRLCMKTCNLCPKEVYADEVEGSGEGTTEAPVITTLPTESCENVKSSYQCWLWRPLCRINQSVKRLCKKTCNLCPGKGLTTPTIMTTKLTCRNIKSIHYCRFFRPLCRVNKTVREGCRLTCKLC